MPLELNRFSINSKLFILCKNRTVEILLLDPPIFDLLLTDLKFAPSIRRNLSIRVLSRFRPLEHLIMRKCVNLVREGDVHSIDCHTQNLHFLVQQQLLGNIGINFEVP